jgi:hypothetical protein
MAMRENPTENVVLLPQTVDFYRMQLKRILEAERYGDAIELLRFLLGCRPVDERTEAEWHSLLGWLQTMFPEHALLGQAESVGTENEELTEAEIHRRHLHNKTEADQAYAGKLLAMLDGQSPPDRQWLALEQLAYIEHPGIDEALILWLSGNELHPLIQFKGLQALKRRGATGVIRLPRDGGAIAVELEETPLALDQFPAPVVEIRNTVLRVSQAAEPQLVPFAEQVWNDFLAFIYGTPVYRALAHEEPEATAAWAAALHTALMEEVHGGADRGAICEMYGITADRMPAYRRGYEALKRFMENSARA